MHIGIKIKNRREELGLTQSELASKLGYKSKTTIAKIESGSNDITQSKVIAFAKALNTTPAYLMGFEDMEKKADVIADLVLLMEVDDDFRTVVLNLAELKEENQQAYTASVNMINAFKK